MPARTNRPACCRVYRPQDGRRSRSGDTVADGRRTWRPEYGPAPAMLPSIGRLGAGTCSIFSQVRRIRRSSSGRSPRRTQDFFRRAISTTFICAAIMSGISLTSSPTRRRSPPQSGQQVPGSSSRRSRTAFADTRGRRRMTPSAAISAGCAGAITSASMTGVASVSAIIRSSSASCSCSISRSIFSDDWPKACFLSLAMRSRRAGGALSARRLDQLVMGAQGGGYPGVLRLQSRDHRLQNGGIIREILGIAGHATGYHEAGQNAMKTRAFRRINHQDTSRRRTPTGPAPVNAFP